MKQRVISGAAAFVVLVVGMLLFETVFLNILLFAAACLCVFEFNKAFCGKGLLWQSPFFLLLCAVLIFFAAQVNVTVAFVAFFAVFFTLAVIFPAKPGVDKAAVMFVISAVFAGGFYSLALSRQVFTGFDGRFVFFMCFALPLCGDLFAYLFGRRFGKRPLALQISPHKTWAGAYAAVGLAPLYGLAWLFVYSLMPFYKTGALSDIGFWRTALFLLVLCPITAFLGIIGDLLASAVKRICGIKDFGWIMPGHGGMADRLDSVCFTAPLTVGAFSLWISSGGLS